MILADEREIERHASAGLWGRATLDGLLARLAAASPRTVALNDAGARCWPRRFPRDLTWLDIEALVGRMAGQFVEAGLKPDETVGIQLPNTAEAVIAHLAALRAKLVPVALPPLWHRRELTLAAQRLEMCALVACDRLAEARPAETMREVAAETLSVRQVFGFGDDIPDGVVPLNEVLSGGQASLAPLPDSEDNRADHVAIVTFDCAHAPALPVARSHNQWLSSAMVTVLGARLASSAVLATTMMPASLAGLATGLACWLLSGCRLMLLMPDDLEAGDAAAATHLVLPGPAAEHLPLAEIAPEARPVRIWRSGIEPGTGSPPSDGIDILSLGEMALWSGKRRFTVPLEGEGCDEPQAQLLSARMEGMVHRAGEASEPGAMLRGYLSLTGPQLPGRAFPMAGNPPADDETAIDPEGFRRTGLRCTLIGMRPAAVRVVGHESEVLARGGMLARADDIDRLYGELPGIQDAAAIAVPDKLLGTRLHVAVAGASEEPRTIEDLRAHLSAAGVAPYLLPEAVVAVEKVPRALGGAVLRSVLSPDAAA